MAVSLNYQSIITLPLSSPRCCKHQEFAINPTPFLSSKSKLRLKKQTFSTIQIKNRNTRTTHIVFAEQSNVFRALQTVWRVGKDGIEAGTSLVPGSIPRPIARIGVTVAASLLALFVLKSFISTAFFVLAMMGAIYFTYIAFNKDDDNRIEDEGFRKVDEGTTSLDDSLEEANRIMEKYK